MLMPIFLHDARALLVGIPRQHRQHDQSVMFTDHLDVIEQRPEQIVDIVAGKGPRWSETHRERKDIVQEILAFKAELGVEGQ